MKSHSRFSFLLFSFNPNFSYLFLWLKRYAPDWNHILTGPNIFPFQCLISSPTVLASTTGVPLAYIYKNQKISFMHRWYYITYWSILGYVALTHYLPKKLTFLTPSMSSFSSFIILPLSIFSCLWKKLKLKY